MKNNIKQILVIIVAVLMTNIVFAQQGKQQEPPPIPSDEQIEEMLSDMSKELSLNDIQEEEILKLYTSHYDDVAKLREENKNSKGGDREAMQKIRTDFEKDVKKLLTKDQQKKFDVWKQEQMKNRQKGKKPNGKK